MMLLPRPTTPWTRYSIIKPSADRVVTVMEYLMHLWLSLVPVFNLLTRIVKLFKYLCGYTYACMCACMYTCHIKLDLGSQINPKLVYRILLKIPKFKFISEVSFKAQQNVLYENVITISWKFYHNLYKIVHKLLNDNYPQRERHVLNLPHKLGGGVWKRTKFSFGVERKSQHVIL